MSEEQVKTERKCQKGVLVSLIIFSFIFSIASLVMSTMNTIFLQSMKKVEISKKYDKGKTFKKAEAKKKPILVLFYADWCRYCQRFAPTFDKVSKRVNSQLPIYSGDE